MCFSNISNVPGLELGHEAGRREGEGRPAIGSKPLVLILGSVWDQGVVEQDPYMSCICRKTDSTAPV